jgi:hypothetical protein
MPPRSSALLLPPRYIFDKREPVKGLAFIRKCRLKNWRLPRLKNLFIPKMLIKYRFQRGSHTHENAEEVQQDTSGSSGPEEIVEREVIVVTAL